MAKPGFNPRALGIGRQKGTPNKKTEALMDICERKGISPFEALLELAVHDDVDIRLGALKEVCSYLYAKRKAVELSGELDMKLAERAKELTEMPREQLVKIAELEIKKLKGK